MCPPVPAMQRFPVPGVKTTHFTLSGHWRKCTIFPQSMEWGLLFSTWASQWYLETHLSLMPDPAVVCSSKTLLMLFCKGRAACSLPSCGKGLAGRMHLPRWISSFLGCPKEGKEVHYPASKQHLQHLPAGRCLWLWLRWWQYCPNFSMLKPWGGVWFKHTAISPSWWPFMDLVPI